MLICCMDGVHVSVESAVLFPIVSGLIACAIILYSTVRSNDDTFLDKLALIVAMT